MISDGSGWRLSNPAPKNTCTPIWPLGNVCGTPLLELKCKYFFEFLLFQVCGISCTWSWLVLDLKSSLPQCLLALVHPYTNAYWYLIIPTLMLAATWSEIMPTPMLTGTWSSLPQCLLVLDHPYPNAYCYLIIPTPMLTGTWSSLPQ